MRRILIVLALAVGLTSLSVVAPPAPTPASHAAAQRAGHALLERLVDTGFAGQMAFAHQTNTNFFNCTGYKETAGILTDAGNDYSVERQTCLALYAFNTTSTTWEVVTRAKCLRNFASWTGCRWQGWIDLQNQKWYSGVGWVTATSAHTSWCYTCDSSWASDSLRHYSAHGSFADSDNREVRGIANNTNVRFALADGSNELVLENAQATSWRDTEFA